MLVDTKYDFSPEEVWAVMCVLPDAIKGAMDGVGLGYEGVEPEDLRRELETGSLGSSYAHFIGFFATYYGTTRARIEEIQRLVS